MEFEYLTPPPEDYGVFMDIPEECLTHASIQYEFGNITAFEKLVRITAEMVVEELGIYAGNVIMEIKEKFDEDNQSAAGLAWDYGCFSQVDIKPDLDEQGIIRVVAHELRHVWQYQTGFIMDSHDVSYYERVQEIDAYSYEMDFWQRRKFEIYDLYIEAIK